MRKFFQKIFGKQQKEPEYRPDVQVYCPDKKVSELEYNGAIEEKVLKDIRDKPFRARRLSSCAPTIKSIKELSNMEEMCEQLDEEPDKALDKLSRSEQQSYKRKLSRRYSRRMSAFVLDPNSIRNGPNTSSTSVSSNNQGNIFRVPSNLSNNYQSTDRNSTSTNSRNTLNSVKFRSSRTSTNSFQARNSNLNSKVPSNNNLLCNSQNLRKGSLFQNRRFSIFSIDSVAAAGQTKLSFPPPITTTSNQQILNNNQSIQHQSVSQNNQQAQNSTSKISESNINFETEDNDEFSEDMKSSSSNREASKRRNSNASKVFQRRNSIQSSPEKKKMLENEKPFENSL